MYLRLITFALLLSLGLPSVAANPGFDDGFVEQAKYPDWFVDTFLDLDDDLSSALENGKKGLIVVFGTQGCSYCYKFADETLRDPEVERLVRESFDMLYLDIFSDAQMTSPQGEELPVKAFARQHGADYTPSVHFFDANGRRVLRLFGLYPAERFAKAIRYVAEGHYQSGSLRNYLAATRPVVERPLVDDPLLEQPPFNLDRRAGTAQRHLMVVFDGPDCDECAYLFGTLFKDEHLRDQLLQLEVVRLRLQDQGSLVRPDGQRTTAAAWHADLDFHRTPAFAFFDEHGKAVMLSDAMMLRQRLDNTLGYVLEKAYMEGISYQRFARRRALARMASESK